MIGILPEISHERTSCSPKAYDTTNSRDAFERCPRCNPRSCQEKGRVCSRHLIDEVDRVRSRRPMVVRDDFGYGIARRCMSAVIAEFKRAGAQ